MREKVHGKKNDSKYNNILLNTYRLPGNRYYCYVNGSNIRFITLVRAVNDGCVLDLQVSYCNQTAFVDRYTNRKY